MELPKQPEQIETLGDAFSDTVTPPTFDPEDVDDQVMRRSATRELTPAEVLAFARSL